MRKQRQAAAPMYERIRPLRAGNAVQMQSGIDETLPVTNSLSLWYFC